MWSALHWVALGLFGLAVVVAAVVISLRMSESMGDLVWMVGHSPSKGDARRRAFLARVRKPDWAFYERHLGRPVPSALRDLYAHVDDLSREGRIVGDRPISELEPIDEAAVVDARALVGFEIVPFAKTIAGDPVYLRPGPAEADLVFVTRHDGGGTTVLSPSVDALLVEVRASVAAARDEER